MKRLFITISVIGIIFSCKKKDHTPPPTAPVVTTAAVTNITVNGATGGGSIVSDGGAAITKSGIVWSKTNNTPTFADSIVAGTTATGTFTSNITGLDFNNTYYVRAFAINRVDTAFGNVVSFSTANDTNKVRFTYNGQEVTYGIIISPTTGKKWLDRNIGAKRQATALDDYQAYGDLFQWGRPADGHQLINWTSSTSGTPVNGTTTVLATTDIPVDSKFILDFYDNPYTGDWRTDNNSNRWNTNSIGPCPTGWHVPTKGEWCAEISNTMALGTASAGGIKDAISAFTLLKLPLAGKRIGDNDGTGGTLHRTGNLDFYWCSSDIFRAVDGFSSGWQLLLTATGGQFSWDAKAYGSSVRCIKD